jgi:4-amino-4-deoxy-L-arabinose transferase-like glycosyltransferase
MVLPWYIAVQRSNPTFYRSFFLEHNLERFATNKFQHHQPAWYYLAVLLIGLMPWTVLAIRALIDAAQVSITEWKERYKPLRYLGHTRAGDAFPEFLVLWALVPIVFFSLSGSKLPGYILPAIPPVTILTGDYLNRIRKQGMTRGMLWSHTAMCALLVFVLILAPQHMEVDTLVPSLGWLEVAGAAALTVGLLVLVSVRRFGIPGVVGITLLPVLGMMVFLLGFHGNDLDINYSARPLAALLARDAPGVKLVATQDVRRDLDYGLTFYRNQPMIHYDSDGVPKDEHLLVIRESDVAQLDRWLHGRIYEPLFLYDAQGLAAFRVYADR